MNPTVRAVCARYCITPENLSERSTNYTLARREVIRRLHAEKMPSQKIADLLGVHVQTVYYWTRPSRRRALREKSAMNSRLIHVGGPRQTKKQRDEILAAYLKDPAKGTALACSRGLPPLYAHKLASVLGLLPVHSSAIQKQRAAS